MTHSVVVAALSWGEEGRKGRCGWTPKLEQLAFSSRVWNPGWWQVTMLIWCEEVFVRGRGRF